MPNYIDLLKIRHLRTADHRSVQTSFERINELASSRDFPSVIGVYPTKLPSFLGCLAALLHAKKRVVLLGDVHVRRAPVPLINCDTLTFIQNAGGAKDQYRDSPPNWNIATFSSGSLGTERLYGYCLDDIFSMADNYRKLYDVDDNSLLFSSLPLHYNFTLIALIFLAAISRCRLCWNQVPSVALQTIHGEFRNTVMIGNPISLLASPNRMLTKKTSMLVDSGGAPLGTGNIRRLRELGLDVREGYGLTENLSLTHFDSEGNDESIGTVGRALSFADHRLGGEGNTNRVYIRSPFRGIELELSPQAAPRGDEWLDTRDLGKVDESGRLRILGRIIDTPIAGIFPRDILDLVTDFMRDIPLSVGFRDYDSVILQSLTPLDEKAKSKISRIIKERIGIDRLNVRFASNDHLTHSQKMKID